MRGHRRGRERRPSTAARAAGSIAAELSVSAVLFQAQCLRDRLETFTASDYPAQTVTIANLFRLLADRAHGQLLALDAAERPLSGSRHALALDLGKVVHVLHSYLRYLQASDPLRTPPGVQQAIALLVAQHAAPALQCSGSDISVLVRPQWTYNLKYIDVLHQFETEAECELPYVLDPRQELGAHDVRTLLDALARTHSGKNGNVKGATKSVTETSIPKHVAVLSFAGLDRDDVLLYPLLAHELGHFLDFASDDLAKPSTDSVTDSYLPSIKDLNAADIPLEHQSAFAEEIRVFLREITADLIATRMAGLAYFFAFGEFFKTLTPWPGLLINPKSLYPGFGLRLSLIWEELDSAAAGIRAFGALRRNLQRWSGPGKAAVLGYLTQSQNRLRSVTTNVTQETKRLELMRRCAIAAIPAIQRLARQVLPDARAARLADDVHDMVELLADRIPPFQPATRTSRQKRRFTCWSFDEVLTAGWLYQIAIGEERERKLTEPDDRFREYQNTCLLLLKALELNGSHSAIAAIEERNKHRPRPTGAAAINSRQRSGGVISGPSLREALNRRRAQNRLVLCPDYGDGPIESASRDLHLGHWFRISKRTSLSQIDIAYAAERSAARRQGQSEVFVRDGGEFVLQPGDFALAASLEYVYLPPDIMAFVEGKSSLGRAGLLIATATQVAPGFKGCIVLELYNAGNVPVILRPAMRVAQLVLLSTDKRLPDDWLYAGSFQVQIRP